jgi:hypothetical protein
MSCYARRARHTMVSHNSWGCNYMVVGNYWSSNMVVCNYRSNMVGNNWGNMVVFNNCRSYMMSYNRGIYNVVVRDNMMRSSNKVFFFNMVGDWDMMVDNHWGVKISGNFSRDNTAAETIMDAVVRGMGHCVCPRVPMS